MLYVHLKHRTGLRVLDSPQILIPNCQITYHTIVLVNFHSQNKNIRVIQEACDSGGPHKTHRSYF